MRRLVLEGTQTSLRSGPIGRAAQYRQVVRGAVGGEGQGTVRDGI